ncbi:hypothetical protein WME89_01090 [Sorangium sp. So ce321]|uniref:hypothetical protein n=1 Tax=Sorangium sp. So ce321 TaxID=3133300 RepID=UPI003F634429
MNFHHGTGAPVPAHPSPMPAAPQQGSADVLPRSSPERDAVSPLGRKRALPARRRRELGDGTAPRRGGLGEPAVTVSRRDAEAREHLEEILAAESAQR